MKEKPDISDSVQSMEKKVFYLPGNIRYQPKSLVGTFGYDHLYLCHRHW